MSAERMVQTVGGAELFFDEASPTDRFFLPHETHTYVIRAQPGE